MTEIPGRHLRNAALSAVSLIVLGAEHSAACAGDAALSLAQVTVAPIMLAQAGKYYVTEGIVVIVLFAAALFAVCRSSSRS